MKKRLLIPVLLALLITLSTKVAICQSIEADSIMPTSIFFKSSGFVNLTKAEKPKEILIEVKEETIQLNLQIAGIVNSGSLTIDIYDPNGKKQDGLTLLNTKEGLLHIVDDLPYKDYETSNKKSKSIQGHQIRTSEEKIEGHVLREFSNPLPGKWVIKIIPKEVDGKFKIHHVINMK